MLKKFAYIFATLFVALTLSCIPKSAYAQTVKAPGNDFSRLDVVLPKAMMPYEKTFMASKTAHSFVTGGFAYIYLKATVTVDGQSGKIIRLNNLSAYQADASRSFVKWEQTSLQKSVKDKSIWAKVTGYVHFKGNLGFADKVYVELERNWTI